MKIGICGTGRMGSSIAQRLMSVGHEIGIWNRSSAKTKPLTDAGAKLYASPTALVEGSEVTIVMLLNDAATEAIYWGPDGILKAKLPGKLVIDMSTVRPDTMKTNGASVLRQGAAFVEAPVGGSIGPAKDGKLLGLVGGSQADVARAMPILEQLCRRIEHVGELGSGSMMKLAVNLPLLVYWQANRHPVRYVRHAGRHERARTRYRQSSRRSTAGRSCVRSERSEKGSGHRSSIRRVNSCRASCHGKRACPL